MQYKSLIKAALFSTLLAIGFTAHAGENPAFLPEFIGGVQDNAIWQDKDFFANASQCSAQYQCGKLSNAPAKMTLCEAEVKTCIANYMTKQNASKQAIAFAGYNSVPSAIQQIKRYDLLDVVYAKMQWADASGGFFIITKNGFIVPTFNKIDISKQASFRKLVKQYPNAALWSNPNGTNWPAVKNNNAKTQVIFTYPVKDGCNACAIIGQANIAYNFDGNGKYLGTQFVKLIPGNKKS